MKSKGVQGKGFSLIEAVLATVILAATLTPMYFLFSSARQMNARARSIAEASALASSYISALSELDPADIPGPLEGNDKSLTGALSVSSMGISSSGDFFQRNLELIDLEAVSGIPFYHAIVRIEWESKLNQTEQKFVLDTLLKKN